MAFSKRHGIAAEGINCKHMGQDIRIKHELYYTR